MERRVEDKNSGSTFSVDKQKFNDSLFMSHNKSYVEVASEVAMDDRCGHINALLSVGNLSNDNHVTCPFH
jgi:nitrite reductase/ring-hydroxylating ferredoxin subunit